MDSNQNFYEILGVPPTATQQEINKAFKKLALQYHPDKNDTDYAKYRMNDITSAYSVLSDPEKRFRYDQNSVRNRDELLCDMTRGQGLALTILSVSAFVGFCAFKYLTTKSKDRK